MSISHRTVVSSNAAVPTSLCARLEPMVDAMILLSTWLNSRYTCTTLLQTSRGWMAWGSWVWGYVSTCLEDAIKVGSVGIDIDRGVWLVRYDSLFLLVSGCGGTGRRWEIGNCCAMQRRAYHESLRIRYWILGDYWGSRNVFPTETTGFWFGLERIGWIFRSPLLDP